MFLTHWLNFLRRPISRKSVVPNRRRVPVQPMTSQTEQLEIRQLLTSDPLLITVDLADDSTNGNTDEGDISLREAIQLANDNPGEDRIEFAESLRGSTIIIDDGELLISDDVTIVGLGADELTISGANANRVFRVDNANVLFAHFSVADGYARGGDGGDSEFGGGGGGGTGMGGGVFVNSGSNVVVQNMIFLNNQAVGGDGGDSGVPGAGNDGGSGGDSSLNELGANTETDATNFGTGGGGGNGSADGTTSTNGGAGLVGGGGGGGGGSTGLGGLRGTIGTTFDYDEGDEPYGVGIGGDANDGTIGGDSDSLTITSAPAASGGGGGGGAGLGGAIFVRDGGGLSVVDTHFARNWAVGGQAGRHSTGIGAGVGGAIFAMDGVVVDAVGITFGNGSDQANLQSTNQTHASNPNTQAFQYDTSTAISNSAVYGQFIDELPETSLITDVESPTYLGRPYLNFGVVGQKYSDGNENGTSVTGVHTLLERVGRVGIREEVSEFKGIAVTGVDDANGLWYALVDGERQLVSSSSTIDLNELLGVPAILKTDYTHFRFEAVVTDSQLSYETGVRWVSGSTIRVYINTHFGTTIGNVLNSLESFTNIYDYFAMQIVPGQLSEFADSADVDAFLATELTEGVASTSFTRAVSPSNALLLSGTDELTFLPNESQRIWEHYSYHYGRKAEYGEDFAANFDYSPFETLTRPQPTIAFRAWDETGGSAGDFVNASSGGGSSPYSSATDVAVVDVVDPLFFASNTQNGVDGGVTVYLTPDTHVPVIVPTDLIPVTGNRQFSYMLTSPGAFGPHIDDFEPNAITLTYRNLFDYGHDHQIDGSLKFTSLDNNVHQGPSNDATQSASVKFGYYTVQGQDTGPIAFIRSKASTDASITHFSVSNLEGGTFYKDAEFTQEVTTNEFISYGNGNTYLYFRPNEDFTGTANYRVIESTNDDFTGTANPAAYTEVDTDAPIFLVRTLAASYANANQVKITNIQNGSLYRLDGETEVPVTDGTTLDWEIVGLNGSLELFFRPAEGFVGNATFDIQSVIDNEGTPELFGDPITKTVSVLRVEKIHVVDKPTIHIQEIDSFEGTDDESFATFLVSRIGDLSLIGETTVDYAVSLEEGDTAEEDDFADGLVTGTITFRPGENYRVIRIPIGTDTEVEANESFTVTLSNASDNVDIEDDSIQGRIWNDDFADFIVEAAPTSIAEGDGEEQTVQFTVTLRNKIDGGIVVDYETFLSSSYEGEHEEKTGQFTFEGNIGETNQITVTFTGDDVYERYERLYLELSSPEYNNETVPFKNLDDYVRGSVEIVNDDIAILTANNISANEVIGSNENPNDRVMRFFVSTNDYVEKDITFDYTTVIQTNADNPATANEDFTPVTGTATISAYSRYIYIDVPVLDNDLVEGVETFGLQFSNVHADGFQVRLENAEFVTLDTATIDNTSQPLDIVTDGDFTYVLTEDALRVFGTTVVEDNEVYTELLSLPSSNYGGISSFSVSDGVLLIADGENGGFAKVTLNAERTAIESTVTTTVDPDSHSLPVYNFVHETYGPIAAANATGLELLSPDGSGNLSEPNYRTITWTELGLAAPQDIQVDLDNPNVVYVLDTNGKFAVVNISIPSNIHVDGSLETNSTSTQLEIEGSIGYLLGDTVSPLIMLDFSDAEEIAELVRNPDVSGERIEVRDHIAYVVQADGSVDVYDVYKPGNIQKMDTIAAGNGVITAVAVSNGVVHVGEFNTETMTASVVKHTAVEEVATGTIWDNDSASVNINDITITESDSSDTSKTFVVSLTEQVDRDVTISFFTSSNTAAGGVDYRTKTGELTITAGQKSGTITLEVIGDTVVEDSETLNLILTNVQADGLSVFLGDSVGSATIQDNDAAQISVENVSASESTGAMQFVASLDHIVDRDVTFQYTVADATTNGSSDYTATTGTVTINAGQSSATFSIPLVNDGQVEANETFNVSFSNLNTNGRDVSLPTGSATGTILNDDSSTLDFVGIEQTESVGGQATFQFELSAPLDHDVQFDYTTVDGTAIAGSDYTSKSGTVTIAAGDTTASVTIDLLNDSVVEKSEAFSLSVSNLQSGGRSVGFAKQSTSLTVTDDDQATVSIDDLASVEQETTKTFTISLDHAVDHDITLDYTTVDGTAVAGTDYVATSGTITISAGETTATVSVELLSDDIVETNEAFALQLSNIQADGANVVFETSRGEFSIEEDDAAQVTIANVTKSETDDTAIFTVTLDRVVDHDVQIDYATSNGTATAGTDFESATGTLTIAAGETTGSIVVTLSDDQLVEWDETFGIQLSNPQSGGRNVSISQNSATGTIQDNDSATVSVGDVSVAEVADGQANYVISLSQPVDHDVTIDFTTVDDTAKAGSDYTAKTGRVSIAAGETSATVSVDLLNDNIAENDESFSFEISGVSASGRAVSIGDATATGIIADDDQSLIRINDVSATETADGTVEKVFTVTLSDALDRDVLIDFATVDGTAKAGSDYTATSGTLTISAGQTSGTISVTVLDDQVVEINEAFFVELSNARANGRGVAIEDSRGELTISDNDQATLSIADGRSQKVSGTQSMVFNVTLSQPSDADVVIDYATADGTAVAGEAYEATSGTLTIAAGQTTGQITVNTINTRVNTTKLTFTVALSNLESNGRNVTIDDSEGEAVIQAVLQSVVTSTIDPESMAVDYPQSVSGNFDGDASQRKDDLLFWDPVTGENLLVLEDGIIQVNPIAQTIVNDAMFRQVIAGNFDDGGSDDLFFWDPVQGTNRLLHLSFNANTNQVRVELQSDAIDRTAINNNDFSEIVVGNFDEGGSQDLFFWNPTTGANRLIHLEASTPGESTAVTAIQTNLVPQAAVNGNLFESVFVGNFIDGGPDELMFLNSDTGANRMVQFATETPGASTNFVSVRVNAISPSAINGNMFLKTAVGDFNSDGLDELFFWDPATGANRLAIVDDTFAELEFEVLDNPVSPSAINGNEYTNLVSRADGGEGDELFFWNANDGSNRVVSSNLPTL